MLGVGCWALILFSFAAAPLEGIPASLYVAMKGKNPFPTEEGIAGKAASQPSLLWSYGGHASRRSPKVGEYHSIY